MSRTRERSDPGASHEPMDESTPQGNEREIAIDRLYQLACDLDNEALPIAERRTRLEELRYLGEKLKESWFPVWFEELETQLRGSRRESGEPINPDRPDDQPALYRVQEWPTVPDDDGESEPLDMPGAPDIEHEQGSQAYVQQQFDTAWDFYDQCVTAGVINLKQKAALICAEVDALAEMAVDQLPDWTKLTDRKTRQLRYYAFRRALKDQGIPRGEVKNLAAFERYVERAIQKVRTYAKPPKH